MADEQSETYHDQVIEAAFLHSKLGCYFIGPYARRVSFASQQFRTLDLIDALGCKGKIPDGGPVAVIGGGIAGLTAVAALRGRKCKVHLYEAEADVLTRQREASHRVVHPTIARWPNDKFSLTTCFPFYDWGAAPCDGIMDALAAEWCRYFDPRRVRNPGLLLMLGCKVERIFSREDRGRHVVRLKTTPAQEHEYELVIVTTGYGAEKTQDEQPLTSYWAPDELERKRADGRPFAVGGCGDGGLIDALRLAHNHFYGGWLAFAVAEKLSASPDITELIKHAEHDALMVLKSLACMSNAPGQQIPTDHAMLQPLYRAYEEAANNLPEDVEEMLDASLEDGPDLVGEIQLISPEPFPTVPFSAPIHKLMLLHAMKRNHILWHPGRLTYKGKGFVREVPNIPDESLEHHIVIQRHGADSGLKGLIKDGEAASLRLRQFMLADRIEVNFIRSAEPPPSYPSKLVYPAFISSRHAAAKALVDAVDRRYAVDADRGGFKYVAKSRAAAPPSGCGACVGIALPSELFGLVPAEPAAPARYDLLA